MKLRYLSWASALVGSLVITGLCIRALALKNIPVAESLIVRGSACLILVFLFAKEKNLSLRPHSIKTQIARAAVAGLALTLLTLSYQWLTASAVAVLTNIDVPLLVILGSAVSVKASFRTRLLSGISILFLVYYVLGLEKQANLLFGLLSLMSATVLLCFGYLFIKKSMNDENEAITVLTPSLAIIVYGLLQKFQHMPLSLEWSSESFAIGLLSGVGMFFAYIATIELYKITDIATAEFPTLVASLVIQPFEIYFFNENIKTSYILASVCFVIVIYFVLKFQQKSLTTLNLPSVAQSLDYSCAAACFESMYRYFRNQSLGEMHFAKELKTLELGYTPLENVVQLARNYGFHSRLTVNARYSELKKAFAKDTVIFVTWWDEDAGHYSLVKNLDDESITLMDPWTARKGRDNQLLKNDFIHFWECRGRKMIVVNSKEASHSLFSGQNAE